MKRTYTILFSLANASVVVAGNGTEAPRPNVILILADDMGYSDLGCYGSEIKTPNLDSLAANGLRFSQFYNAGRSCPSRASLLTGLYPHQAGVGDMLQNDGLPAYQKHLNRECVTLGEVLKSADYHTIISGKWHVGGGDGHLPTDRGFDKQYYSNAATGHHFGVGRGRSYMIEGKEVDLPGEWIQSGSSEYKLLKNEDGSQWYSTDAMTDYAMKYINEIRDVEKSKPYFLYLPYTAPHWPLHAFEEDIAKYQGSYLIGWDSLRINRMNRLKELGLIDEKAVLSERHKQVEAWNDLSESEKIYQDRLMSIHAAMVDRIDQNIGRLLKFLNERGEMDNTIILFLSDNGGSGEKIHKTGDLDVIPGTPESYDGFGPSWANLSNAPFKRFKRWTHEGGISTPLIVWYPKLIKEKGRITDALGYVADVMPTIVELSGATYPQQYKKQAILPTVGKSLVPVFKNEENSGRNDIWWEHEGNRAFRSGDWKIVSAYENKKEQPWELYNVKDDRTETSDLSVSHPDKLNELVKKYKQVAKEVQAIPYQQLQKKRKRSK